MDGACWDEDNCFQVGAGQAKTHGGAVLCACSAPETVGCERCGFFLGLGGGTSIFSPAVAKTTLVTGSNSSNCCLQGQIHSCWRLRPRWAVPTSRIFSTYVRQQANQHALTCTLARPCHHTTLRAYFLTQSPLKAWQKTSGHVIVFAQPSSSQRALQVKQRRSLLQMLPANLLLCRAGTASHAPSILRHCLP